MPAIVEPAKQPAPHGRAPGPQGRCGAVLTVQAAGRSPTSDHSEANVLLSPNVVAHRTENAHRAADMIGQLTVDVAVRVAPEWGVLGVRRHSSRVAYADVGHDEVGDPSRGRGVQPGISKYGCVIHSPVSVPASWARLAACPVTASSLASPASAMTRRPAG
jgi:hypothetical protein